MAESSQACLYTADDDRRLFIGAPDQVAVNDDRIVRTFSGRPAGTVGILMAMLSGDGIVIDHGIHIA